MNTRRLVPMAFVADVQRSIDFYAKLGFAAENTHQVDGKPDLRWAYLVSGEAHLMVARATAPVIADEQAVLFYVYCDDVAAAHGDLAANSVKVSAISTPFYAPRGEFRVTDPDGYAIMITHT